MKLHNIYGVPDSSWNLLRLKVWVCNGCAVCELQAFGQEKMTPEWGRYLQKKLPRKKEVWKLFMDRKPEVIRIPSHVFTCASSSDMCCGSPSLCHAHVRSMLMSGRNIEKICFPVHRGLGFNT